MNEIPSDETPTSDAPGPGRPREEKLQILEEVAQAKNDGQERLPILEKHGVNWSAIGRWKKELRSTIKPLEKEQYPHFYRLAVQERMAHARSHVTQEGRKRSNDALVNNRKMHAPRSASEPNIQPIQKKIKHVPKNTPLPTSATDIISMIANDREALYATVEECLSIIDSALNPDT